MASSYLEPPSPRRRLTAIALTILVHLALVWLLLHLTPRTERFSTDNGLQAFDVAAPRPSAPQQAQRQEQRKQTRTPQTRPIPPKPPIKFKDAPNVIWMSKDQFAATDIDKLRKSDDRDQQQADAGAKGGARDSKALYGPGAGPGGQQLYAAEWQREPTDAELKTYLPPADANSWGIIACRTIPDYRVENCQTMGESPLGSGIATGMRRAAWQFRVIPPRIGGQPKYGTWVRIRIEFTPRGGLEVTGRH